MDEPGCYNCQYGREETRGAVFARDRSDGWGTCRRRAPVVAVVSAPERAAFLQGAFPRVRMDDWCGEYQGRALRTEGYAGFDD
ncbi:MAG: hypothetical protein R2826_03910 [Thermoleophilia bacterium]